MTIMCADCGEFLRVKKMGVKVRYGYYRGYFRADLYECPKCGKEVINGFAHEEVLPEDPIFDENIDFDFGVRE